MDFLIHSVVFIFLANFDDKIFPAKAIYCSAYSEEYQSPIAQLKLLSTTYPELQFGCLML